MSPLHLRSISLRSLNSEVKNRNQISPRDSPIWKNPVELCPQRKGEAWQSEGVWNESECVSRGCFRHRRGWSGEREGCRGGAGGQRSYKCLKFALYIAAAARTELWETAFLRSEEMAFDKAP